VDNEPLVSVIMSVYNGEKYLKECIESILNQTYKNFEFLIIDDNSKDNSYNILKEYAEKEPKIKLFKNDQNMGLTKNLNFLILKSKGEYLARMDADDISFKNRLESQINFIKSNEDIDILGSFAIDIDEEGKEKNLRKVPITLSEIKNILPKVNPIIHPTVLMKKSSLKKINFYNEKYRTSQDYELWYRAIANNLNLYNMPEPLIYYRVNNDYYKRKSWKYRINDFKLKRECYKIINLPFYKYYNLLIPLILAITPEWGYKLLKKLDPR
jgi:glycosyltransferase involved in cell wall biosynthesis